MLIQIIQVVILFGFICFFEVLGFKCANRPKTSWMVAASRGSHTMSDLQIFTFFAKFFGAPSVVTYAFGADILILVIVLFLSIGAVGALIGKRIVPDTVP